MPLYMAIWRDLLFHNKTCDSQTSFCVITVGVSFILAIEIGFSANLGAISVFREYKTGHSKYSQ